MKFLNVAFVGLLINSAVFSQSIVDIYFPIATNNQWVHGDSSRCLRTTIFDTLTSNIYRVGEGLVGTFGGKDYTSYMYHYIEIVRPNVVWKVTYLPRYNYIGKDYRIVDFSDSSKVISWDSTIVVAAGVFNHCVVFNDGKAYAPNVGQINNLIYAKVNGVEYGDTTFRVDPPSSVVVKEHLPETFTLHQNYPNPFNGTTTISFELEKPGEIDLSIYDINGHKVKTLISEFKDTGQYQIKWDATNSSGKNIPSGVYLIRLITDKITAVKKMAYAK